MRNIIIALVFFMSLNFYAQDTTNLDIVSFREKLSLRAKIKKQDESFTIVNNNNTFNVEALNTFKLQLAANYKFIGFSISFAPKSKTSELVSRFFEWEINFFTKKKWIQSFNYSKTKGFFANKAQSVDAQKDFPNLKTIRFTGTTSYVFNPKFSLQHLINHNAWQRQSAGSFIPALNYGINKITDLVENEKIIQNNLDLIIKTSYYYTWCFNKNWFISSHVSPGIGVRFSSERQATGKTKDTHTTRVFNVGLQYGYTSHKISTGIAFNFRSNKITNNAFIRRNNNNKNDVSLYFTYRIKPPKKLKKLARKIEEKTNL